MQSLWGVSLIKAKAYALNAECQSVAKDRNRVFFVVFFFPMLHLCALTSTDPFHRHHLGKRNVTCQTCSYQQNKRFLFFHIISN